MSILSILLVIWLLPGFLFFTMFGLFGKVIGVYDPPDIAFAVSLVPLFNIAVLCFFTVELLSKVNFWFYISYFPCKYYYFLRHLSDSLYE